MWVGKNIQPIGFFLKEVRQNVGPSGESILYFYTPIKLLSIFAL